MNQYFTLKSSIKGDFFSYMVIAFTFKDLLCQATRKMLQDRETQRLTVQAVKPGPLGGCRTSVASGTVRHA